MKLIIDAVSKRFKSNTVLDAVSLEIARGEVVGFVGPNGAGKTTTMKIAAGLLKPSAGEVRIGEIRLASEPTQYLIHIGVLIDSPAFYPTLSAYHHLAFLSRMRGELRRERVKAALEAVGFDPASHKHAGQFSTGMKQRLGIAMALLHEPQFLILDEPTNGLDPVAIVEMRTLIGTLASERGIGLLVSSHLLHEIEQVCNRVLFIRGGKMVAERRMDHAASQSAVRLLLRTSDDGRARELMLGCGFLKNVTTTDAGLSCRSELSKVEAIAPMLIENGIGLIELRHERESLEQVYLSEYAGKTEVLK